MRSPGNAHGRCHVNWFSSPPSHQHADKLCLTTIAPILFILFILSEDDPVSPTQSLHNRVRIYRMYRIFDRTGN